MEATATNWVTYAKKPFAGPEQVIRYLGNYTHRIAISNHRLIKMEAEHVHFNYRDSQTNSKKTMILHTKEFIRRFLLHVLPPKFVRIRHYGFLGSRFKASKLKRIRDDLNVAISSTNHESTKEQPTHWKQKLKQITGIDITICKVCRLGEMIEIEIIPSWFMAFKRTRKVKWMDTS